MVQALSQDLQCRPQVFVEEVAKPDGWGGMSVAEVEGYVTAKEIAEMLGCGIDTVYRHARTGRIPAVMLTERSYRFRKSDVIAALQPAKRGSWVQSNRSRARKRVTSTNTRMDLAS